MFLGSVLVVALISLFISILILRITSKIIGKSDVNQLAIAIIFILSGMLWVATFYYPVSSNSGDFGIFDTTVWSIKTGYFGIINITVWSIKTGLCILWPAVVASAIAMNINKLSKVSKLFKK